jgi:hypothetical protein
MSQAAFDCAYFFLSLLHVAISMSLIIIYWLQDNSMPVADIYPNLIIKKKKKKTTIQEKQFNWPGNKY